MSAYLTEALGAALVRLLANQSIEKIGVDLLAAEAGVGRASYFRNFTSREAVLTDYILLLWERYEAELDMVRFRADPFYRIHSYFQFCYIYRNMNERIIQVGCEVTILRAYESIVQNHAYSYPDDSTYESAFLAYGLYGVFLRWAKNGYEESPEAMTELMITRVFGHELPY